ncbi:hypothetical protein GQ457_04G021470 [Hibiscus cannabinus]
MRVQEQEPGRKKDQLIFYECKKSGHIRTECPQLKRKTFGKKKMLKAHVVTWIDEESSDEDEEEIANLCLVALDDEPKISKTSIRVTYVFDRFCFGHLTVNLC